MKLAFISDIHSNFDALKAVMTDIKKNKVERFLFRRYNKLLL